MIIGCVKLLDSRILGTRTVSLDCVVIFERQVLNLLLWPDGLIKTPSARVACGVDMPGYRDIELALLFFPYTCIIGCSLPLKAGSKRVLRSY